MDIFIKVTAGVLVALVMFLVLTKQNKDFSLLLSILVCCIVAGVAISCLDPVLSFIRKLEGIGNIDGEMLGILMKAVGIGLLSEIACLICTDAGNSAMGKTLQLLGSVVILGLSVPLLESLLNLVEEILVSV